MKTALLAMVCLIVGILGALGYSHYLGEGKRVAELQAALDDSNSKLAKASQDTAQAKSETDAMSAQIQQLTATKQDLTKQVDDLKSVSSAATPAPDAFAIPNAGSMAGIVKSQMENQNATRLQLLKARLHLTPDQEAAVKAAMDAEEKRTEEMTSKMFAGGKIDMKALAAESKNVKSVDQTLDEILTPEQKTANQQMKTDEKNGNAETMASMEMNQVAPLLQLTDAQKDQVGNALYQVQLDSQDPEWIKKNTPSSTGGPLQMLDIQAKAKEDALAKILTPDQLATYHQQAQSQLQLQKTMMQKFMPAAASSTPPAPPSAPNP
jgi:hypothetical protein